MNLNCTSTFVPLPVPAPAPAEPVLEPAKVVEVVTIIKDAVIPAAVELPTAGSNTTLILIVSVTSGCCLWWLLVLLLIILRRRRQTKEKQEEKAAEKEEVTEQAKIELAIDQEKSKIHVKTNKSEETIERVDEDIVTN